MTTERITDIHAVLELVKAGLLSAEEAARLVAAQRGGAASAGAAPAGGAAEEPLLYCAAAWEPAERAPGALAAPSPLLIFDASGGLREALAQGDAAAGLPVLVTPGDGFAALDARTYRIDVRRAEDYERLLAALDAAGIAPAGILHALSRSPFAVDLASVDVALAEGASSLIHLAKALIARRPAAQVPLLYLHATGASAPHPAYDAVGALLRTLRVEDPRLAFRAVGVAGDGAAAAPPSAWVDVARQELALAATDDIEVRYEGGRRHVRRLRELAGDAQAAALPLRQRGVYLITGGLGGLGRIFAEHLARGWRARLVLAGRAALGDEQRRWVRHLEASGAEVLHVQADVAERASAHRLAREARARFGAIDGVIHGAGVLRDALLARKTQAMVDEVLAPKVQGTLLLDEALAGEALDLFVLLSSMVAVTGNAGQTDYAFACGFQDSFAAYREHLCARGERRGRTLSFGSPLWRDGGMTVDEATLAWARRSLGLAPLGTGAGLSALEAALRGSRSHVVVLAGDREAIRRAMHVGAPAGAPRDERSGGDVRRAAGGSRATEAELRARAEGYLRSVLADELKLQAATLDPSAPFETYGIDSMMVVGLTRKLEDRFGTLSKTLFFEHRTVGELAAYFADHHGDELLAGGVPAPAAARRPATRHGPSSPGAAAPGGRARFLRPNGPNGPNGSSGSNESNGSNGSSGPPAPRRAPQPGAPAGARDGDVAIIGLAGRYPMARDLAQFWDNLRSGRDCITEVPAERWDHAALFDPDREKSGKTYAKWGGFLDDVDRFDPLFFNISPREAELTDPQERLFLEASFQAVEDAGYTRARLSKGKVGVFVGVMYAHYPLLGADAAARGDVIAPGSFFAGIANRVSYFFDLRGPSVALDTLCSSSLTAIHLACQSLRAGDIDMAIAGGVNVTIHPAKYFILSQGKFASSDGRCRSFGEGGDGYVPGEGVGAILLKPLGRALADGDIIHAVIKATAINHGGKTSGLTVPSPGAQGEVIAEALRRAGVDPRAVSYVEAHGTGTALGDPIEMTGLKLAFGAGPERAPRREICAVGSVKSNIGHLESAAGIAGVTKVLAQMKHRELAPSLHAERLNPNIDFDRLPFRVQRALAAWNPTVFLDDGREVSCPRIAGVSSFGAGGSNAHVILEEHLAPPVEGARQAGPALVVLSSRGHERLVAYARALLEHIERIAPEAGDGALADLAYTLQVGREPMEDRLALVVSSIDELSAKLRAYVDRGALAERMARGTVGGASRPAWLEGEAGDAFLSVVVARRDLAKLAEIWVAGVEIDWERLAAEPKPRRVSLPPRPLLKERCWLPASRGPRLGAAAAPAGRLHPLIEANTSGLDQLRFSTRLAPSEPILADHVVQGHRLLPGMAILEMARAAAELAGAGEVRRIRGAVWSSPIVVAEGGPGVEVSVGLFPEDEGVAYEAWTAGEDGARRIHAQGMLLRRQPAAPSGAIDLAAVRSRCPTVWSGADCYRWLRERGLVYGSSFQSIRELAFGRDEALAHLALVGGRERELEQLALHPTLLDGALQALIGPLQAGEAGPYVPFSLAELEQLAPLSAEVFARVQRAGGPGDGASLQKFDVELLSMEGRPLLRIRELAVRPLGAAGRAAEPRSGCFLHEPVWEEQDEPPRGDLTAATIPPVVLVLDVDGSLRDALKRRFAAAGARARVLLVTPAAGASGPLEDAFVVRPDAPDDYRGLASDLARDGLVPGWIVHAFSRGAAADDVEGQLARGFRSILYLTQALVPAAPGEVRLLFVHPEDEAGLRPAFAAVGAFAKTLRLEDPRLRYGTLALRSLPPAGLPADADVDRLVAELAGGSAGAEVRLHGDRRLARRFREHAPEPRAAAPLTPRGVHVITGGAGGLGLLFAEHLARSSQARLVLSGRSELTAGQRARLRELEQLGAEVLYVRADVARRGEAAALMAEARTRFGAIDGVIHAAGVTRDALTGKKTPDDVAAVLAPKVQGALALDEATQGDALGLFVVFSSMAAVLGNVGQCDYAFANSFLDHFAERREQLRREGKRSGRTISFNWPLWQDGGMQVAPEVRSWMREVLGWEPLETRDGLRAFAAGLLSERSQLLVVAGDRARIAASLAPERVEPARAAGRDAAPPADDDLRARLQVHLRGVLAAEVKLPVEKVAAHEPFERFGIDSVMIMNMTRQLERLFGELPKTLFFERRSLAELAAYLLDDRRARVADRLAVPAPARAATASGSPAPAAPDLVSWARGGSRRGAAPAGAGGLQRGEGIAIIGVAGRYPMAEDLEELWDALRSGKDCITEIPEGRWDPREVYGADRYQPDKGYSCWGGFLTDVDKFDPLFFAISPREAKLMDPQERLFLETAWHAIEDAGYAREQLRASRAGVFVGVMYAPYQLFSVEPRYRGTGFTPSSLHASIANRVAYVLDFRGPSIAVDTMCSSSLTALHLACASIRRGECEVAIAGGVNLSLHPNKYLALGQGKFTSSDGRCRSFGDGGDGYVPGEGVGAVLLKPLGRALEDGDHIHAVIRGSAVNHGGRTNGYTVPNPAAQGDVVARALADAGVDPAEIDYVEAHGTGTSLGDPIEIAGLVRAFEPASGEARSARRRVPIGSVKSNIGHLESAAGIAAVTKVLLQLKHGELAPSLHADRLNPNIDFSRSGFHVQTSLEPWPRRPAGEGDRGRVVPRVAGVSSFGAGGANAHVVIEEHIAAPWPAGGEASGQELVVLSARSAERLDAYARKLARFLARRGGSPAAPVGARAGALERRVLALAAEALGVVPEELDPEEALNEIGFDPLSLGAFAERLQQRFGVEAGAIFLDGHSSVRGLSERIASAGADDDDRPTSRASRAADGGVQLPDVAFTLQVGREPMEERLAVIASTLDELRDKLERYAGGGPVEGLVRGNARSGRASTGLSLGGADGAALARAAVDRRDLPGLAELWAAGADIAWAELHRRPDGSRAARRRVPLPTYPFAREPHWLPEAAPAGATPVAAERLHPLLRRVDPGRSLEQERGVVFQAVLRADDPLLRDHRVNGKTILPGVGYLEMARAAAAELGDGPLEPAGVIWLRPLVVEGGEKEVAVVVRRHDDELRFEIQTRDGGAAPACTHCSGALRRRAPSGAAAPRVAIEAIRARCPEPLGGPALYAAFEGIGIEYGPYYRRLEQVWTGDAVAVGRLALPAELARELDAYVIHPTLMDAALQVIGALGAGQRAPARAMLPFSVEAVEISGRLPRQGYAVVERISADRYDVTVVDDEGQPCVRLADLALRPAKEPGLAADLCHVPVWSPVARPGSGPRRAPAEEGAGAVLIVGAPGGCGLEAPLARAHAGADVVQVTLGTTTRRLASGGWELDTSDADALDRWLAQVTPIEGLGGIDYLAGIEAGPARTGDLAALDASQALGVISLFRIVKSLLRLGLGRRALALRVVTNEAHVVLPGEPGRPHAASLFGLSRSLAKECPAWAVTCVDVSLPRDHAPEGIEALARDIVAEPADARGREVALRDGRRYERSLLPLDLPRAERVPLRRRGVYMILGGAGGIGLELARHLAEKVEARLVLVGRSEPGEAQRARMRAIEELGGRVLHVRADAADLDGMRAAVREARARFQRIDGVVHSAIVLEDRTIEHMDEATFRAALAPKVRGSVVLYRALAGEDLDFLLFFSSAQSFSGNPGQSNYAAASTFEDAFARHLGGVAPYPVKVVNWGFWGEVGVVASEAYRKRLAAQGIGSIRVEEGMDVVERVLASGVAQVVPVRAGERQLAALGVERGRRATILPTRGPSVVRRAVERVGQLRPDARALRGARRAFEELAHVARLLLLDAFQRMGALRPGVPALDREALRRSMQIDPRYDRLFDALVGVLRGAGFVEVRGDLVAGAARLAGAAPELAALPRRRQELSEAFPEIRPHLRLLSTCLESYPAILRGTVAATDVMFPRSSLELVEGVYKGNPVADWCNRLVAEGVQAYVDELISRAAPDGSVKILEVGAGTGGTTQAVLPALGHRDAIGYWYTDLSVGFTQSGKKRYGADHPFVRFEILNIEDEVRSQGYTPGAFDVVIAANVLHATRSLRSTLRNVKSLLKANGVLVLNEVTEVHELTTLTFGLLDGWWLYDDPELRIAGSPLLDPPLWDRILAEEGFVSRHHLGGAAADVGSLGQHVIMAESDGIAEERAPRPHVAVTAPAAAAPVAVTAPAAAAPPRSSAPPPPLAEEHLLARIERRVVDAVASALTVDADAVDVDRQFAEYGIDSILGIDLINAINKGFGITLRTTALFDHSTARELSRFIERQHGAHAAAALAERADPASAAAPDLPPPPAPSVLPPPPVQIALPSQPAAEAPAPVAPSGGAPERAEVDRRAPPRPAIPRSHAEGSAADARHLAVRLTRPGGIGDVHVEPFAPPDPGEGEVQVLVRAFSLNFGDLLCVKGLYPTMPDYPFTPGFEVSGVVSKVGPGVRRARVGDEVIGLVGAAMGGHATAVNLAEGAVARKPPNVTHEEACAFPIVFLTMHRAFELARVTRGERVLIHTAAGGTGLIAVQLAREIGAEIYATAGSREKLDALAAMGVPHLVNYLEEDFGKRVRELSRGRGVDVVFNTLSHDAIQKNIDLLAPGGRYVEIAMTGLRSARSVSLAHLVDNQTFHSLDLRKLLMDDPALGTRYLDHAVQVLAEGRVRPTVARTFRFSEIRDAYRYLEDRRNIGKIVVTTPEPPRAAEAPRGAPAPAARSAGSTEIAIVGMAGRFPGGRDLDEFWQTIVEGKSAITEVPKERWDIDAHYDPDPHRLDKTHCRWGGFLTDIDKFDPLFFNLSGKEAQLSDPQQRLFLEVGWSALEDAGYGPGALWGSRTGVFVGVGQSDYVDAMVQAGVGLEAQSFWGNEPSVVPARLSYFLNLKGPAVAVNTACSSSLVALHLACRSLLEGEAELAVAGGVFVRTTPHFHLINSNAGMLSPDGRCMTFDNRANGYVPGEGVGALVLKRLDLALRDGDNIHAVIRCSGVNQDGRTNGLTAPSTVSQAELERSVYERAGVDPASITLVEAHGTGTKLGDPIEIEALTSAFRSRTQKRAYCAIGSVKTNIGHCVAAAGVAAVIKVVLSLKHRQIPPSANFHEPNEHIDFASSPFFVPTSVRPWELPDGGPRRAGVSSFGFSGTNAHLVVEEAPEPARDVRPRPAYLFALSARTEAALARKAADLRAWLEARGHGHPLGDVALTLHVGRKHFTLRLGVIARTHEELLAALRALEADSASGRPLAASAGAPAALDPSDRLAGERLLAELSSDGAPAARYEEGLRALLGLYVRGHDLDWGALYQGGGFRRVSLPTYPFARSRCWFAEGSARAAPRRAPGHPLLEGIDAQASLRGGLVVKARLTRALPTAGHHRVQGNAVVPGVGHLEMAVSALASAGDAAPHDLTDVVWLHPLVVGEAPLHARIVLHEERQSLLYRIESDDAGRVVIHSKGTLRPRGGGAGGAEESLPIDAIKRRCASASAPEDRPYERLGAIGIAYGSFFQGLRCLWRGDGEALGLLELPAEHAHDFREYLLHPTIMDGALQAVIGITPVREGGQPFLPFSVERVEVLRPLERRSYAHVRAGRQAFQFNVTITDEAGRVCVKIHEIAFRELKDPLARFFYAPAWRAAEPAPRIQAGAARRPQRTLLVRPSQRLGLVDALRAAHRGDAVVDVELGRETRRRGERDWEVDVSSPDGLSRAIAAAGPVDLVYFLGGVELAEHDPGDVGALGALEERSVLSLFRAVKALDSAGHAGRPLTLKVITSDACEVHPGATRNPCAASLFGFVRSLAKERPRWQVSCIDIAAAEDRAPDDLAAAIASEPAHPGGEEIALRAGQRHVRAFRPVQVPPAVRSPFRAGGTYLVLGGAGGLGLELGSYLAERAQAKVAILGRSPWGDELRRRCARIEEKGGEALYLQADASDPARLEAAVRAVKERFGAIHGAIHSALVLRDRTVEGMDEATLRAALAPKVAASASLYRALRGEPLDFVLFFSSSQSFLGNAGQSNYAAGCTFEDAFAQRWRSQVSYPVKVLNWGYWGDVGVVSGEDHQRRLAARGLFSIRPAEGMEAVQRILASEVDQVMPIKASDRLLASLGVELPDAPPAAPPAAAAPAGVASPAGEERPALDARTTGRLLSAFDALDAFAAELLLSAFRRMGALLGAGEAHDVAGLKRRLGIVPAHDRLFEAMLRVLADAGFVEADGRRLAGTPALDDPGVARELRRAEEKKAELAAAWPEIEAHLELLWACAARYEAILRGEALATDVLFPRSSMALVENIYKGNRLTDHFNQVVAWSVRAGLRERLQAPRGGEAAAIVEIGAGTGGTTGAVLDGLGAWAKDVRYVYTDVSAGFTQHGRRRFGAAHPGLEFRVLDIERAPDGQGFAPGEFDVAIATNVLHATKNVARTLSNVARLLRPGGLLVLNEVTAVQRFTTLTFGLLDGWWLFDDEGARLPGSPLLDAPAWTARLREAGFGAVTSFGLDDGTGRRVGQHVLVATLGTAASRPAAAGGGAPRGASLADAPAVPAAALADGDALRAHVEQTIAARVAEVLQLDRASLDPHTPYSDFGVDSLLAADIAAKLAEVPGFDVKTTDLFNHASIHKLASHVIAEFGDAVRASLGAASGAAPARAYPAGLNGAGRVTPAVEDGHAVEPADPSVPPPAAAAPAAPAAEALHAKANCVDAGGHGAAVVPSAPGDEVAIIGISGRFPGADDVEAFWRNLADGKDAVREISRWDPARYYDPDPGAPEKSYSKWGGLLSDIYRFDPLFFHLSPREAELMDPQHRLFLEETWKAIEDAGYADRDFDGRACSVFVGVGSGDYGLKLKQDRVPLEAYSFTGNSSAILTARISYLLNLKGPAVPVDTACSSSLVALHLACESLRAGANEMAIVGGVAVMSTPEFHVLASRGGMLSPGGRCKAFDARADGFVPGEAVGVVILKGLTAALRDGDHIRGVIAGSGINQDGKTNGITSPSGPSQTALECEVYDRFGIDPGLISYVEAHGTGTKLGDPIEVDALTAAFRRYTRARQFCAIGSVKTNIGHALTASGIVGLIKVLLCMERRQLVPSLHVERTNGLIDFDRSPFYVSSGLRAWTTAPGVPRLAAISSFGFSGTNAHVVVREAPEPAPRRATDAARRSYLLPLSAKTEAALLRRAEDLLAWIERRDPALPFGDVAYSLCVGRSHFPLRIALIARDAEELAALLRERLRAGSLSFHDAGARRDRGNGAESAQRKRARQIAAELGAGGLDEGERRARLEELAAAFLADVAVDWASLFAGEDRRRVPLPTYAFSGEIYRTPEPPAPGEPRSAVERSPLHPLVDDNLSTLRSARFRKRFPAGDAALADHIVLGRGTLPGAAYLEMARVAASIAGEREVQALRNVAWMRPLQRDEAGGPLDVLIELRPRGAGAEFDVTSAAGLHAQGSVVYREGAGGEPLGSLDVDALGTRCPRALDPDACYRAFSRAGLRYGPSFRGLSSLRAGATEALARIELPAAAEGDDLSAFVLHPSLLDAALQTVIAFGAEADGEALKLPVAFGEIALAGPLPRRCVVHAAAGRRERGAGGLDTFHVRIADEAGKVLASIKDFAVRAVDRPRDARAPGSMPAGEATDAALLELLTRLERGALRADEAERLLDAAVELQR
uniref:TAT polyketide synthase n=1 Tax=Sorangium cellulosum TaxID=56 RepID=A0A0M3STX0_SORCE|nr:tAT polyketide synthase [Sorangium cellulosum]